MTTIKEQINNPYVGELVHLISIDTTPITSPGEVLRFTPSSSTPINFGGQTYFPLPLEFDGMNRSLDNAPGRIGLKLANMNGLLAAKIITLGDLVNAKVKIVSTFKNFLDGETDGGSNQSFPEKRFIIFQMKGFSQQAIEWELASEFDRPVAMLPLRQCLKSDVGKNTLWAPGMQRVRL